MRIIAGKLKGRRIIAPKKLPVRPTTDRSKESLFNILNNRLEWDSISALDLFAGTGNISYELSSRGVNEITSVDQNRHCIFFITKTSEILELPIFPIKSAVNDFLQRPTRTYDFIFADPPYSFTLEELISIVDQVILYQWISDIGILVIEHDKHLSMETHPHWEETRTYGSNRFSFFRKKAGHKPDSV